MTDNPDNPDNNEQPDDTTPPDGTATTPHSEQAALDARQSSRRKFLAGIGAVGVAGFGATLFETLRHTSPAKPSPLTKTQPSSGATTAQRGDGIVVLVTLYGGNDGLNTVVPYTNSTYASSRGDLAIRAEEVLVLDAELGLNPGLQGFKDLWDAKRLAVVRGVGYPNPNRSHFRSMDIWQSGIPDRVETTGWLGRWLDSTDHDPMLGLAIGTTLPLALRGKIASAAVVPPGRFTLPASPTLDTSFRSMASIASSDTSLRGALANANHDLITVQQRLANIDNADAAQPSLEQGPTPNTANGLSAQLDVVAKAIRNNSPTRVYSVSLGGFDTHATERAAHIELHHTLGDAVARFLKQLDGRPEAANVAVLIYSEFGRRVAANASGGTDHGTAAPVFVAGPRVHGGFYGEQPNLTDLDQGDLKYNTDFRSVYATLLDRVLDTDPNKILATTTRPLPFL